MNKRWIRRPVDELGAEKLAVQLGQPPWLCRLMTARGVSSEKEARRFLKPSLDDCHDPFLLRGMEQAISVAMAAMRDRKKIVIYGDYDVDGITSTALLITVFKRLGADVDYFIPDRITDGYGLNSTCLDKIHAQGAALVITVDCGTSSVEEAAHALTLGLQLIITDHHVPGEVLPQCAAVLNPKISPEYPYNMLGGVGVAFKFAQALSQTAAYPQREELLDGLFELVAMGTVCDVAPLNDENRVLVREGIKRLRLGRWPGIVALCDVSGVALQTLNASSIGFALGPRLNAGGRIGDPSRGVELLLCRQWSRCKALAQTLDEENIRRKAVEKQVLQEAKEQAQQAVDAGASMLILAGEGWHPGVIGLAASRITEAFHRPTFVLAIDTATGKAKGSGRARKPLHLVRVLDACQELLIQYGGHEAAAGLTMENSAIGAFREKANRIVQESLSALDREPRLSVDLEVELKEMKSDIMQGLNRLSPFGIKNPKPIFVARRCMLGAGTRTVGGDNAHLKIQASQDNCVMPGIAFGMGQDFSSIKMDQAVDIAFQLDWNEFRGNRELQLNIKDIRQPAGAPLEETTQ